MYMLMNGKFGNELNNGPPSNARGGEALEGITTWKGYYKVITKYAIH